MYWIAPANALRPYKALCGPLTISMRSMSTRRGLISSEPPATPMASLDTSMPSTSVATFGRPRVGDRPRTTMRVSYGAIPRSNPRLGSPWMMPSTSATPRRSSCSTEMAVTDKGTSCKVSSRLRAVTTTSSRARSLADGSCADAVVPMVKVSGPMVKVSGASHRQWRQPCVFDIDDPPGTSNLFPAVVRKRQVVSPRSAAASQPSAEGYTDLVARMPRAAKRNGRQLVNRRPSSRTRILQRVSRRERQRPCCPDQCRRH